MARDNYDESKTKKKKKETPKPQKVTKSPSVTKVNNRTSNSTFLGGGSAVKKVEKTVSNPTPQRQTTTTKRTTMTDAQYQKTYGEPRRATAQRTSTAKPEPVKRTTNHRLTAAQTQKMYGTQNPKLKTAEEQRREREERRKLREERRLAGQRQKSGLNDQPTAAQKAATDRAIKNTPGLIKKAGLDAASGYGQTLTDVIARTASSERGTEAKAMKMGIEKGTKQYQELEEERKRTAEEARKDNQSLYQKMQQRQEEWDKKTEGAKGLEKAYYGAVESGTGMLADTAIGLLTGTGQVGALTSMGLRTYGSSANQARSEGATETEAAVYGLLQAGKEMGTEMIGGGGLAKMAYGKGALGLGDIAANTLIRNLKGQTADLANMGVRLLGDVAEENIEEFAGWALDPWIKELTYGKTARGKAAMQERSNALRAEIKNDDDARSAAAYISSDDFIEQTKQEYIAAGMKEKEAEEVAERMRDYLTASLTGDTDSMEQIEDEVARKVGGSHNVWKDYSFRELKETFEATTLLVAATGLPGNISTMNRGNLVKEQLGAEGVNALANTAIDFEDSQMSTKAKAMKARIDSGKELTGTQVYELQAGMQEQVRKDTEREQSSRRMAARAIENDNLLTPYRQNENGGIDLDEATMAAYRDSANKAGAIIDAIADEKKESITDTQKVDGSKAIAGFQTGVFTVDDANALNYSNTAIRSAFETATGINLGQYVVTKRNGEVDIPATNTKTKDTLFAMAADNLVKSAQAETANWMDNAKGQVVTQVSARMGAQGSAVLQQALDDVDERDRSKYMMTANATDMLYQAARNMGTEWESIAPEATRMFPGISESKLKMMYEAGLADREMANDKARGRQVRMGQALSEMGEQETATGKVFIDTEVPLKGSVIRTFTEIAKNLGADIHFVDYIYNSENNPIEGANGSYDPNTNTFYLNVATGAETNIGYIFMHETTHYLKTYAPEQYQALENLVRERWFAFNPSQMQDAIARKIEAYKRATNGRQVLTEEQALEEIIADASHDFINDPEFAKQVAEEDMGLAKAVLDSIRNALRMLRRIFASGSIDDDTHMNSLFRELDILKEAEKLWLDAYKVAVQNSAINAVNTWQDDVNKASSTRGTVLYDEANIDDLDMTNKTVEDSDGNPIAQFQDNGDVSFSISSYEDKGRDTYIKYLNKMVKSKELSQEEADDMLRELDTIYNISKRYADSGIYAPFSAWSSANVVYNEKGKPVFSAIKKNSEYKMNIDFSTICKKRRTLDAVFREMINRGMFEKLDLNKDESAAMVVNINNLIRQHKFEAACALCFVEARRYRQQQTATTFTNMWNELVESMYEDKSKIAYFNFGEDSTVEDVPDGIHTMDAKNLDLTYIKSVANATNENGKKLQTAEAKAARLILKDPTQRKLMRVGDMMASTGFENMQIQNPKLMKIYNAKKGTGGAKSSFGDVQYLNEILKSKTFDRRKAYAVSGVRIQSFSDYVPRMVFDYVQVIADLAAKKLPAHAYTKEKLFAYQFGLTGAKINLSLVPDVVEGGVAPGLDAKGNYVWNKEGTFPYEEAMALQKAEGYKDNCGTIAVGISDEQIMKMLADPTIQMVIPYHKSSLNPIVAAMTNVDRFKDYTDFQNTKDADGKTVSKDFDWDNKLFELTHDKEGKQLPKEQWGNVQDLVKEYADWCKERNYTPKFSDFLYMEDGSINPGYYKLLEDFALLDNDGNFKPQGDVQMRFPTENDAFGSMAKLIGQGLSADTRLEAKREREIGSIVDEIDEMFNAGTLTEQSATSEKLAQRLSITPEMDDAYMDAVNSGNMEEAQRLVDEAAKMAGFDTPLLHHGTPSFGFTTFDLARGENIIFATNSRLTAETYSGETSRSRISEKSKVDIDQLYGQGLLDKAKQHLSRYKDYRLMSGSEKEDLLDEARSDMASIANDVVGGFIAEHRDAFDEEKLGIANRIVDSLNKVSTAWNDDDVQTAWDDFQDAIWDLKWADESIQLELSREIQSGGALQFLKNRISDFMYAGDLYARGDSTSEYVYDNQLALELGAELNKGIYGLYGNPGKQLVIDANGSNWNQIIPPDELGLYGPQRTRSIAEAAKAKGYDSVLFKDLRDNGGATAYNGESDVYMFFNPNQVKSADPVTYAEDGSVIPLSERFDPTNNDIRYSLPTQDSDGNVLTDGQMEYFKNSQARDSQGRLVPVYHTTNKGGFYIFDPLRSDDHRSLFFSDDWDVSQTYGEYSNSRFYNHDINNIDDVKKYLNAYSPDRFFVTSEEFEQAGGYEAELVDFANASDDRKDFDNYLDNPDGYIAIVGVPDYSSDNNSYADTWVMANSPDELVRELHNYFIAQQTTYSGHSTTGTQRGYYACYLNLENPMIIDAQGQYWDSISVGELPIEEGAYFDVQRGWNGFNIILNGSDFVEVGKDEFEIAQAINEFFGFDEYAQEGLNIASEILFHFNTSNNDMHYGEDELREVFTSSDLLETHDTRGWAEIAQDEGYDGVIFRNVVDLGGKSDFEGEDEESTVYVAFSSNQVKDINNENPTENPDIRYSIPDENEVKEYVAQTADNIDDIPLSDAVLEQNRQNHIASAATFQNSIVSSWEKRTLNLEQRKTPLKNQLISLMKTVRKDSGTERQYKTETLDETIKAVKSMYEYAKKDNAQEFAKEAWDAAERIVDDIDYNDDLYEKYKEMQTFFERNKIAPPSELYADEVYGEFETFKRENDGKIRWATHALQDLQGDEEELDLAYRILHREYPMFFTEAYSDNPIDQLMQMAAALNNTDAYRDAYTSEEHAKLVENIANNLCDIVSEGNEYRATIDELKVKAMKQRHEEALRKVREERNAIADYERNRANRWKQKYNDRIQKEKAERNEKADKREHLKSFGHIEKNYNKLCTWVLNPTKEKNVPEEFRKSLADFLQALDLQTENSKKLEAKTGRVAQKTLKMRELKDRLNDLSARKGDDGTSIWEVDESIAFLLGKLSDKLDENGNTIDALDNDDIATIDVFMQLLIRNIERYKQVKTETKMAELSDIGGRAVTFLRDKIERDGMFKKKGAIQTINATALTPAYLFDRLGALKEMYDVLRHNGFDTYIRNEKMIMDRMGEILSGYYKTNKKGELLPGSEAEKWRDDRSAQTIDLENGKSITMTAAQMMSLYCLTKRGMQAIGHMCVGGVVVTPIQAGSKIQAAKERIKNRGTEESTEKRVLTINDIRNIISTLTEDQIKVADQLQSLMSNEMAQLGNEAHRELYGYEMFNEDNYFPIKVYGNERSTDINTIGDVIDKIKSFGFTKPLTPNANKALEIDDIFTVVADHCNGMNLYNAYLVPITDFMKVLNYTHTFEDGEVLTMKEAIEQAYGKDMLKYILNLMKDINGIKGENRGGLEGIMNKALGTAKRTAVFGNVRVALQQPTAIVRAAAEINPKYIKGAMHLDSAKGFIPTVETKTMQEMWKYCPIAQWKAWGYYDTYMGRDIEDVMMNKWSIGDKLLSGYYGQLDNATWSMIWQAVKAEQRDAHPDMDHNSEEFLQICGRRASEVFDKTQVVDSTFHRSDAMRNKQIAVKLFTAFMAEPTLTMNVFRAGLFNANEASKAGNKGEAAKIRARAITVIVVQAVVVSAAQAFADAWRGKDPGLPWDDDDDEEKIGYWWRWIHNFVYNAFNQAHLENNMYLVKDVTPYINYMISQAADYWNLNPTLRAVMGWDQDYLYSQNNLVFAGLENTATGIQQLFKKLEKGDEYVDYKTKEPKKWYDIIQKIASGIGTFTGLPVGTLMRDFKPFIEKFLPAVYAADIGLMDSIANKMGYQRSDSTAVSTDEEETAGNVPTRESLPDNLSDEQKDEIIKSATKRAEKAKPAEEQQQLDYDTMLYNALKAASGLEGEEYNKKVYSSVANGLKGYIADGDYTSIGMMRTVIEQAGGDVDYFDKRVLEETKTAYKKTLSYDQTLEERNNMKAMYRYMMKHGMTQEQLSEDILYSSDLAKDMKVAYRLGDDNLIYEAMLPLVDAGITRADLEKLYTNRNKMDLNKYKEYGRYKDKLKSMGTFIWPTDGQITSYFGYRNAPTRGASSNHPAIDIGAPMGSQVVAADGGVVISAGWNGGYGNSVGIKHDNGMVTYYNHLSAWNVKEGDTVAQGQPIANVGSTGISTGPHLDFKILDAKGEPVDPLKYLASRS